MIPILYKKDDTNYTRNGAGFLSDIISCDITEERNGEYEMTFEYPATGLHYSEIAEGDVVKVKANETSDLQLFRIYAHSKPINGIATFNAEHISYDANGIPLVALSAKSATPQTVINKAIREGAFESRFKAWSDISTLNSIDITEPCSLRAVLGGQHGSVLDIWGGEYEFDNYTIRLHAHRGTDRGVTIEYGKNLTDIQQERNITEAYTHILPYAMYTEKTDSENGSAESTDIVVTLTEKVLPLAIAENVGHQKALIVNLSDMFGKDEEMTEQALRNKANQYIASHDGLGTPKVNIKASFVSLWQTEEYKNIAPLERVQLCDTVTVRFVKLGISAKAKVIKTVYDTLNEKYKSVELGEARSSFADTVLEQENALNDLVTVVRKGFSNATEEMKKAIAEATALITGNLGGYVVLHPADKPQEILIMDTPDINTAVHVWRWNSSGLGYSSTGYNGEYGLAITMNGAIVADFITAGTLDGNLLRANSVQANAISAGFKQEIADNINGAKETVEQEFKVADEELKSQITTDYTDAISGSESTLKTLINQTANDITMSVSQTYATKSTIETMQTSINQNATNISLKVSKDNLVSEINQSAGVIKLTSNRFVVESDNFILSANGTITATNVNLNGSLKTISSDGIFYNHVHGGVIETFYDSKRVAYIRPVFNSSQNICQYAILGSGNYDGVAIGGIWNNSIETYYRCNINTAYSTEDCRHHFIGSTKFDDQCNSNFIFTNNKGVAWGSKTSNNIGLRYSDSSSGAYGAGLYLGITGTYACDTYLRGASVKIRANCYAYNGIQVENSDINMIGGSIAIANEYGIKCGDNIALRWTNSVAALCVGIASADLRLYGSTVLLGSGSTAVTSDARNKKDIAPLADNYLQLIRNISPVSYKYDDDISLSGRTHTGLIAQDVLQAMTAAGISANEFAAFIDVRGDGSEYALRYEEFIAPLLAYVKHLEERITDLERTI